MAIPESQLETWSHQGSITQSSTTYNSIKNVLEARTAPYAGKNYEIFLQGSYGNDTNIYAESDVDIVIRLNDTFLSDLDNLSQEAKAAYNRSYADTNYTLQIFKQDVLGVLRGAYGDAVREGSKAITIDAGGTRRKADVIASCQYRRYFNFKTASESAYVEGICFYNSGGTLIANYPKQHSSNLTNKHQESFKWLKPMIRVLKNMRGRLQQEGLINEGLAPSYYLEGLLYNVPTNKYASSYQDWIINTVNWFRNEASKTDLLCANEQYYLLRDGSHTCWSPANCEAFINATAKLWNEW